MFAEFDNITVIDIEQKMSKTQKIKKNLKTTKKHSGFSWHGLKTWQKIFFITIGVIVLLLCLSELLNALARPTKTPQYGVSFSKKYAQELGNDWKANYDAILNDLNVKHLRLMSYWDLGEPEQGQYDFTDLDYQMDEAAKHGAKVSLAIGLRQPRWPECHQPQWAKNLKENSPEWQKALDDYITAVQNRYKNHPALESYQLENEAKNAWFGECNGPASDERLVHEFNLAKQNDPNHPVYMSLSDQHGLPIKDPVPDKYGFSVYRVVWNDKGPFHFYLTYPTPLWYHKLRAWIIKQMHGRDVFIHELQVEPWGPKATVDLTVDEQNRSMSTKQMQTNLDFAKRIGKDEIYLWGSEWWYWRKTHFNDPGPWNVVKQEIQKYSK